MFGNFQLLVPPKQYVIDITANVSVPMLGYLQDQQWEMELLSLLQFHRIVSPSISTLEKQFYKFVWESLQCS